jgi:hypothetical protein
MFIGENGKVPGMSKAFTIAAFVISSLDVQAAGDPVSVPAKFDGRWDLEASTASGACPATTHVQIDVAHGIATATGSMLYTVKGGISLAGVVRGTIATFTAKALVNGAVDGDGLGRGTWRTQEGGLLNCSGSWTARRA